jgi:hypothetical protein
MIGCTPFFVEEASRNGSLKYKVVGGTRISTVEQIEVWLASFEEQSGAMRGRDQE